MFFINQPVKVRRRSSFVHCIVEKPRSTPRARNASRVHSKIFSTLMRKLGLESYRFDFVQKTITSSEIEGRIFLRLKLDTDTPNPVCLVVFNGTSGGGVWSYSIEKSGMSAYDVFILLRKELFKGKDQIYAQSKTKEVLLALKKWWTKKTSKN
jgi:hypothetical protein